MSAASKTTASRLERGMAVLETLKYCREVSGNAKLGTEVERAVIEPMLADLVICTAIDETDQEIARLRLA